MYFICVYIYIYTQVHRHAHTVWSLGYGTAHITYIRISLYGYMCLEILHRQIAKRGERDRYRNT